MEKTLIDNLLALANAYAKARGIKLASVSKEIYGGVYFFEQLKSGQTTISIRRASVMFDKFREVWPDNATWPTLRPIIISRPKKR